MYQWRDAKKERSRPRIHPLPGECRDVTWEGQKEKKADGRRGRGTVLSRWHTWEKRKQANDVHAQQVTASRRKEGGERRFLSQKTSTEPQQYKLGKHKHATESHRTELEDNSTSYTRTD